MDRKLFKFYKSYWDVAKELSDKDRLLFFDALMEKQFTGKEPKLNGMSNFAYVSQKHSIEAQIKGWEDKTNTKLSEKQVINTPMLPPSVGAMLPPSAPPSIQVEVKEEEKVKVEVEVEDLMSDNDFFEKFWNMYDKKVGNKQGCMKKFKRLKSEEVQKIFNTLPSFIASIKDKKFQPFPETYINQKRWNDEIVVKSQTKTILYTNPTENKW